MVVKLQIMNPPTVISLRFLQTMFFCIAKNPLRNANKIEPIAIQINSSELQRILQTSSLHWKTILFAAAKNITNMFFAQADYCVFKPPSMFFVNLARMVLFAITKNKLWYTTVLVCNANTSEPS